MMSRASILIVIAPLATVLAGCEREAPTPEPTGAPVPAATALPPITAPTAIAPTAEQTAAPPLDTAALEDRANPDRLLRFYAAALAAGDWNAAARVWGKGSGVTAATLKAAYSRPERPRLEVGKGSVQGAAGSLYYEAPVVLRFGPDAPAERGSLVLRRVNDVPGASAEQLRWHIERSTIGAGQ